MLRALEALAHQSEDPRLCFVALGIAWHVKCGKSLSQAMSCYPRTFRTVYLALVKEGENCGEIEISLDKAAELLEDEERLHSTLKSSLQYPALVLLIGILSGGLCLKLVAPVIAELVADSATVSLPTQILLALVALSSNTKLLCLVLVGLMTVIGATWRYLSTNEGRRNRDRWLLEVPVLGKLVKEIVLCRVARTLAVSSRSGVRLTLALELCAEVAGNLVFRRHLLQARKALIDGVPLENYFDHHSDFYTSAFSAMILVGQTSGNLDQVADKLADLMEVKAKGTQEVLLSLVQPLVIGLLGIAVAGIGLATLLPVYQLL